MKWYRLIERTADVFFWAFGAGMAFSGIMMFASRRPFRSAGCMLICIGLALACANLEMWARGERLKLKEKMKGELKHEDYYQKAV